LAGEGIARVTFWRWLRDDNELKALYEAAQSERDGSANEHVPDLERAAIVRRICERMADGLTVKEALGAEFISRPTLWRWLQEDETLLELFRDARIWQAHAMAEDVVDIADGATAETANAVRLSVDSRKWLASKIAAKLYGERVEVQHGGSIETRRRVALFDPNEMSEAALATATVQAAGRIALFLPDNHRDPEFSKKLPHVRPPVTPSTQPLTPSTAETK
jgi:hypothetical protein